MCPGNISILSTSELWGYGYIVSTGKYKFQFLWLLV